MPALFIDKKDIVKDLDGLVCVHRGRDAGDAMQVAVDEGAQAAVVFHGAVARPAPHE